MLAHQKLKDAIPPASRPDFDLDSERSFENVLSFVSRLSMWASRMGYIHETHRCQATHARCPLLTASAERLNQSNRKLAPENCNATPLQPACQ